MKIICDTHVHCYDLSEFSALLDHAYRNFSAASDTTRGDGLANSKNAEVLYLMFFTDGRRDKTWAHIYPRAVSQATMGGWRLSLANDAKLITANNGDKQITLAPARQINSAHRLEFLLLGCDQDIEEGILEQQVIDAFAEPYALICPWGFGKWIGSRAKVLRELLSTNASRLFLGDNGGRPGIWGHVPHFRQSRLPIINGSDPLPLKTDTRRIGSFGIHWTSGERELSLAEILEELKTTQLHNYGEPLSAYRFFRNQLALKLKTRN